MMGVRNYQPYQSRQDDIFRFINSLIQKILKSYFCLLWRCKAKLAGYPREELANLCKDNILIRPTPEQYNDNRLCIQGDNNRICIQGDQQQI